MPIPIFIASLPAKDLDGLARYLAGLTVQLAAAGAELSAAIVGATPHICAPQLMVLSPLPPIDMIEAVADNLRAKDLQRVALLGTRFTIETRMFGRLGDIEVIMPRPDDIEAARRKRKSCSSSRIFIARDGAKAVLVAGTDLSPMLEGAITDFSMVDCARIHIDTIVRRLLD